MRKVVNKRGAIENYFYKKFFVNLSVQNKEKLRSIHTFIFKFLYSPIYSRIFASDLTKLALHFGSDKAGSHEYTKTYNEHLKNFRKAKINLLEIGVGGHEDPNFGGHSLRMWKKFFPNGGIFSIDIFDKKSLEEKRIKIFQGSQDDEKFIQDVFKNIDNGVDIVIDDGSHINMHVIRSFEIIFPLMNSGGIYIVEDTHTSYTKQIKKNSGKIKVFGGNSDDLNDTSTSIGFFKSLVDCMNYEYHTLEGYKPSYYDYNISSISFYKDLVFIYKA